MINDLLALINSENIYLLANLGVIPFWLLLIFTPYHVLTNFTGKVLEGLLLQHPFLDRQVPVVLGEHVTTDAGTGAVHTAPAHGLRIQIWVSCPGSV